MIKNTPISITGNHKGEAMILVLGTEYSIYSRNPAIIPS